MRQALSGMKKPRFALNPQSDAAHARLIVLDEVSMVGEEMARDLLSFKKPILVLGDPGQLPPINGEGAFTRDPPDVMLTEIHRQAGESAIIRLATMARQGEPIGFGCHDAHVWKMRKMDVTPEQALRGGQVICGKNATRLQLNNAMRAAAGFGADLAADGAQREDHLPQESERPRPDQRHVRDPGRCRRRGQPLLLGPGDGRGGQSDRPTGCRWHRRDGCDSTRGTSRTTSRSIAIVMTGTGRRSDTWSRRRSAGPSQGTNPRAHNGKTWWSGTMALAVPRRIGGAGYIR